MVKSFFRKGCCTSQEIHFSVLPAEQTSYSSNLARRKSPYILYVVSAFNEEDGTCLLGESHRNAYALPPQNPPFASLTLSSMFVRFPSDSFHWPSTLFDFYLPFRLPIFSFLLDNCSTRASR